MAQTAILIGMGLYLSNFTPYEMKFLQSVFKKYQDPIT